MGHHTIKAVLLGVPRAVARERKDLEADLGSDLFGEDMVGTVQAFLDETTRLTRSWNLRDRSFCESRRKSSLRFDMRKKEIKESLERLRKGEGPQTKDGRFLTQQVGSENLLELNELLGAGKPRNVWNLEKCRRQVEEIGLKIIESKEARISSLFKDVGAVVCYLLSAPWQISDFSIDEYLSKLKELHIKIEKEGALSVVGTRFYVSAIKKQNTGF